MHQIKISKRRYCTQCHVWHSRNDLVFQCPFCEGHARDNQLYSLESHNLSLTGYGKDKQQACRSCIQALMNQQELRRTHTDSWIVQLQDEGYE